MEAEDENETERGEIMHLLNVIKAIKDLQLN